jgi:hypothetical protein
MRKNRISLAQTQLPFAGNRTRALATPLLLERRVLASLTVALVVVVAVYGVCIALSVNQVAARQATLRESRHTAAQVAELEGAYLAAQRGITEEYARAHGFVAGGDRTFVSVSSVQLTYGSDAR